MYNLVTYRIQPVVFDEQEFMKSRIRQEKDFVKKAILQNMNNDSNLMLTLLQNLEITEVKEDYEYRIIYYPFLHIVPAEHVLKERQITFKQIPKGVNQW